MWRHGSSDAIRALGLDKVAVDWSAAAQGLRRFALGEPGKALEQLRRGTYFGTQGMVRDYAWPQDTLGRALTALSVLNLVPAARAPAHSRGSSIGGALGQLAGGAVGAPFGIAGALTGGTLLGALGRQVGRAFDSRRPTL